MTCHLLDFNLEQVFQSLILFGYSTTEFGDNTKSVDDRIEVTWLARDLVLDKLDEQLIQWITLGMKTWSLVNKDWIQSWY